MNLLIFWTVEGDSEMIRVNHFLLWCSLSCDLYKTVLVVETVTMETVVVMETVAMIS